MILFYSCQRRDCAESGVLGEITSEEKSQRDEASQPQASRSAAAPGGLLHQMYASERFALVLISQGSSWFMKSRRALAEMVLLASLPNSPDFSVSWLTDQNGSHYMGLGSPAAHLA